MQAHQAVQAQALPLVHQRRLVHGQGHGGIVPGPGALALHDAPRHGGGGLGRFGRQAEFARQLGGALRAPALGAGLGQRHASHAHALQQGVHGAALARGQVIGLFHGGGRRSGGALEGQLQQGEGRLLRRTGAGLRGQGVGIVLHERCQARPPAVRVGATGLHARQRQALLGPGDGNVERVQFLALALGHFGGQGVLGAGGRAGFAGQEDEAPRQRLLARPVHQHGHGFGLFAARVGVEQQHAVRLQAFGAMHGEQAHGLGIGTAGGGHATLLHGAHEGVGGEVAATVLLQRAGQQRTQVGQHAGALRRGGAGSKARQHVAVLVDGLQRIVRGQVRHPFAVLRQIGRQRFAVKR